MDKSNNNQLTLKEEKTIKKLKELKLYGQKLLWELNIPVDHGALWDIRGAIFFFHILRWNNRLCQQFVKSKMFNKFILNTKINLIVVDHIVQECFSMSTALLKYSPIIIQYSNWPICDVYSSSFNVELIPSAYPVTGTFYSPKDLKNFFIPNQFYASIGHKNIKLNNLEKKRLFYAGRSEFLLEPIKPISNRIKHFEFPEINWEEIDKRKFILISFGSIAKVKYMPKYLLKIFLKTFGSSPYLIIWQTNSPIKQILNKEINLPLNIKIIKWAPIKLLLAHPNLKYSILHGGINTLNEAIMFGKPILGIPLQGDQPSNLQRLVDLGMAELISIKNIWLGELIVKMSNLELNYNNYLKRALKISKMIKTYRKMHQNQQNFWLKWAYRKIIIII
ncbi:hypothetical protein Mgra_00001565 [Meloidogyne graminicola]|uniref:glucuronosyltransferase n=1 Tax=Meloidogyne graminicola TaxID=189291 RepID=A0A8T0A0L0_9BILA|nr:hypothetical protein Mgra_00001565 [Meloidogyne graminicola]